MTTWIATMFHKGGPAMYEILYLGVPGLLLALFHATRPRKWSAWATAGVTVLVFAIGLLAWRDGVSRTDSFLEREARDPDSRVTATDRAMMREAGYAEAVVPLEFGSIVAAACALPLLIGELRRARPT